MILEKKKRNSFKLIINIREIEKNKKKKKKIVLLGITTDKLLRTLLNFQ